MTANKRTKANSCTRTMIKPKWMNASGERSVAAFFFKKKEEHRFVITDSRTNSFIIGAGTYNKTIYTLVCERRRTELLTEVMWQSLYDYESNCTKCLFFFQIYDLEIERTRKKRKENPDHYERQSTQICLPYMLMTSYWICIVCSI